MSCKRAWMLSAKRRASEGTLTGTCTSLLTFPVPEPLNQAPFAGSVLDDDGGTTLVATKKNKCCWFGSSFVLLQQQHQ
eukprot:11638123-Prorocentrum_lima.AAC.1